MLLASLSIHFLIIWVASPSNSKISKLVIDLQKGGNPSISFSSHKNNLSSGEMKKSEKSQPIDSGTLSREIAKFTNQIQFPEEALEQGLESDCEWKIKITETQTAGNIQILTPCRYQIFEKEFLQSIAKWKFALEPGTEIRIPVRFKIQEK
jgi:TonB family protein